MATVTALATEVMTEVGEDSTNATLLNLFEQWLREVFQEIGVRNKWRFMNLTETITTAASTNDYKLDVDAQDVIGMRIPSTDEPIQYTTYNALVDRGVNLEEDGSPELWWYDDVEIDTGDSNKAKQSINFWPIPDAIYSIEVRSRTGSTELADSDHVPLPYEFQYILKDGIKWRYFLNEEKENMAGIFLGLFRDNLQTMIRRYRINENADFRLQITDVPIHPRMGPTRFDPSRFSNDF